MRQLATLAITILTLIPATAQVHYDFEDGNITQWYSEGDGDFGLNATEGLPGQCLQVNDDATGDMVIMITPYALIGDWSGAAVNDSISYDLKPISSDPDVIPVFPYLIQLNGPGGAAVAWPDFMPTMNQWQRVAVPIDPAAWTVTAGTWDALLADVSLIRIRAEFITGEEYTLMDNVGLSFSPVRGALGTPQVCSPFDLPDDLDGWGFDAVSSIVVDTTQGVPPNSLRVGDASGVLGIAMAPPKFRGDWSEVDGSGTIDMDVMVQTSVTTPSERPFLVRISGTGGAATININDDQVQAARNAWTHWTLPIQESAWTLESGSWSALLQDIAEIRVQLEFFSGDETTYLDNFCIGNDDTGIAEAQTAVPALWPNPAGDLLHVAGSRTDRHYEVIDARGARMLAGRMDPSDEASINVAGLASGVYTLRLIGTQGIRIGRFVK
ncbi:MAG: T9SS type A sorting domain-containing protein [Flavobacteriales bacterium]|nr:T9SS type A sorting domain-containing protein [Flavobacteriales bacterium]